MNSESAATAEKKGEKSTPAKKTKKKQDDSVEDDSVKAKDDADSETNKVRESSTLFVQFAHKVVCIQSFLSVYLEHLLNFILCLRSIKVVKMADEDEKENNSSDDSSSDSESESDSDSDSDSDRYHALSRQYCLRDTCL